VRGEGAGLAGGHAGEELVVVRHAVDRIEVHCHGGTAAPEAVIAALVAQGARRKAWQEWPGSDSSIVAREARAAMVDARGPRAARILCRQRLGTQPRWQSQQQLRTCGVWQQWWRSGLCHECQPGVG
jgi:hypothetical protein